MGKRVCQSSLCSEKKTENHFNGQISHLPDEILIRVLSLLALKEAGRSSVLSRRWRDLWKFTTVLNFDSRESVRYYEGSKIGKKRAKYVTWVNQVLKMHQCSFLDEFRVSFAMYAESSHVIDEWINFAILKGVKRLEINLHTIYIGSRYILSPKCYSCFKSPHNLSRIKSLSSLTLRDVNVKGELLEFLLSNCPLLEFLFVFKSEHIVTLKVAGSSLQLKHLEINLCVSLESLEVSAPKLVTFKYFGQRLALNIRNLPLLSKLYIGGQIRHQVIYALVPFSSYLSHIETLELDMHLQGNEEIPQLPEFTSLKHLILTIRTDGDDSLLGFTSLLEAAPSLRKLTLQLSSFYPYMRRVPKVITPRPHKCLEVVEMIGFTGCSTELDLFLYLVQNAINLDSITFDPYPPNLRFCITRKEKDKARKRAHKFEEILPVGVKSVVL